MLPVLLQGSLFFDSLVDTIEADISMFIWLLYLFDMD